MPKQKMRTVEYYRLWAGNGGDSGTWDVDFVEIPADTPDDELEAAVHKCVQAIDWEDEAPIMVGLYSADDYLDDEEEADNA